MWWPPLPSVQPLADAAAGSLASYIPQSAEGERIEAVTFEYAAAGGGTARVVTVSYLDNDGSVVAQAVAPFTLASGKASRYGFFVGGAQYGANDAGNIGGPLPGFWLSRNQRIEISATNHGAGDHITDVRLVVSQRVRRGDG